MAILVALVAARDIVSTGLRCILEADEEMEVLDRFPHVGVKPDIVLYDAMGVAADGGAELCGIVRAGSWPVLVIGRDLRPSLAARARAHGAYGCVSLEAEADELRTTIREVARCGRPDGAGVWPEGISTLGAQAQLRPREIEVLSGIAQGLSNADICERLGLGLNTVKSYIRSAYRKIGVTTRAQAVGWCLSNGFEPPA